MRLRGTFSKQFLDLYREDRCLEQIKYLKPNYAQRKYVRVKTMSGLRNIRHRCKRFLNEFVRVPRSKLGSLDEKIRSSSIFLTYPFRVRTNEKRPLNANAFAQTDEYRRNINSAPIQ